MKNILASALVLLALQPYVYAQSTLEKAYQEHQAGNVNKAFELYNEVIASEPGNLDALWNRGLIYGTRENYKLALADLKKVSEGAPNAPLPYNAIGWYSILDNNIPEARKALQQGYKLDSTYYALAANLGHTYLLQGDAVTARKYYAKTTHIFRSEDEINGIKEDFHLFIRKGMKPDLAQSELSWITSELDQYGKQYLEVNTLAAEAAKLEYTDKNYPAAAEAYERALRAAVNTPGWDLVAINFESAVYWFKHLKKYDKAAEVSEMTALYFRNKPYLNQLAFAASEAGYAFKQIRKFDKSEAWYKEAIDIAIKTKSDWSLEVYYHELGQTYDFMGRKNNAIETYKKSIEVKRRVNDEKNMPITMNNLASVYNDQSRFKDAVATYEEALALATKHDLKNLLAVIKAGLARAYQNTSSFEKALQLYREALELDRAAGNVDKIPQRLSGIGMAYDGMKQYDKALETYNEAMSKAKEIGDGLVIANLYNNMGAAKDALKRPDEALEDYRMAVQIYEKVNYPHEAALAMLNMSKILIDKERYGEAAQYLAKAEGPIMNQNNFSFVLEFLKLKGGLHLTQKQYAEANKYFEMALERTEQARQQATGEERKIYLASQMITYQMLAASHIYNAVPGSAIKAFHTIEQGRAKILAEKLSGSASSKAPSTIEIQDGMTPNQVLLNYFAANTNPIMQVVITTDKVVGNTTFKDDITAKILAKYEGEVNYVLQNQRGMKLVKAQEKPSAGNSEANAKLENIVAYYRTLLMSTGADEQRGFKVSSSDTREKNSEKAKEIGKLLYQMLVQPVEEFLAGKTEITIIPDGILGYIPFETLIDGDGRYMIEKYHITYAQSSTVLDLIRKRNYPATRKQLLALGGGVYDEITYNVDMVDTHSELASVEKSVAGKIASRGSLRADYASLGVGQWINLPGTLAEVQNIQKLVPGAEILTGTLVSENKVKELASTGTLANYKVLHFATHGIVVPSIPEMSALVLSQFKSETGGEDGYLRMSEIESLKIKADYVNLSACETGLGKIYGGEGVVGLTQAFLVAGANGLSVSLWQVADESTSKFMAGMYELTQKQGMTYAKAITEMKRRFIRGEAGEQNTKPYFWAPFVYYGK